MAKRKTKAQRPPAAIDDPVAVALLLALRDGDPVAAKALADWLEEQQDPRAADVRELAEARCAVPLLRHPQLREAGLSGYYRLPMACAAWWSIWRSAEGVEGSFYCGTPQGDAVNDAWGRAGYSPLAEIPPSEQTDARLRAGFEFCRAELIIGLCGHITKELHACGSCGRGYADWEDDGNGEGRCGRCNRRRAAVGSCSTADGAT